MPRNSSSSSSSSSSASIRNRRVESKNISTVSVSLPTVAAEPVSLLTVAATLVSLPTVAAEPVSLPTVAATLVSLPTVAAADASLSFVSASALGTFPDVSLNMSAAPSRKRPRLQKSQDRDGNESDNSDCTGDVRTDDSVVEEESRLDADLAQYNQVRRNLTDRDEVEDSDSGDI